MFAQLRSGALEMMQASDNILANVALASNIANLPFVFDTYAKLWEAMDGGLGHYIHAQLEKLGLHVFEKGWDGGLRNVFTKGRPVHTPDDMKGLKLRVPEAPIQIAFFKALGASPTPIPVNELYSALQTNLVDGAEQALASLENAKYYEVSKYVTLTKHQATSYEMMANAAAWRRLPADLQEIATRNLNKFALLQRVDIDKGEAALKAKLAAQGMTFITPDRELFRAAIQRAGLYAKWRDTYGAEPFALLEKVVGKLI
jgi:tripartite ATP-independent transporter DctP family solute receptor